jgi:hypothetical protein
MPISSKLKWKRLFNELRFLKEEETFTDNVCKETAPQFEEYYAVFCAKYKIDAAAMREELKVRQTKEQPEPDETPFSGSICETTAMQLYNKIETKEEDARDEEQFEHAAELHALFKKVFKKIALRLHPDKVENFFADNSGKHQMTEDFNRASKALEEKRYYILIEVAERYNISLPRKYDIQNRWFKHKIKQSQKNIQQQQLSYNYLFAECETDEQRDRLMKHFLKQMFGSKILHNVG